MFIAITNRYMLILIYLTLHNGTLHTDSGWETMGKKLKKLKGKCALGSFLSILVI
jgi:hypothetical protein